MNKIAAFSVLLLTIIVISGCASTPIGYTYSKQCDKSGWTCQNVATPVYSSTSAQSSEPSTIRKVVQSVADVLTGVTARTIQLDNYATANWYTTLPIPIPDLPRQPQFGEPMPAPIR